MIGFLKSFAHSILLCSYFNFKNGYMRTLFSLCRLFLSLFLSPVLVSFAVHSSDWACVSESVLVLVCECIPCLYMNWSQLYVCVAVWTCFKQPILENIFDMNPMCPKTKGKLKRMCEYFRTFAVAVSEISKCSQVNGRIKKRRRRKRRNGRNMHQYPFSLIAFLVSYEIFQYAVPNFNSFQFI